jgi:hypothetical protein
LRKAAHAPLVQWPPHVKTYVNPTLFWWHVFNPTYNLINFCTPLSFANQPSFNFVLFDCHLPTNLPPNTLLYNCQCSIIYATFLHTFLYVKVNPLTTFFRTFIFYIVIKYIDTHLWQWCLHLLYVEYYLTFMKFKGFSKQIICSMNWIFWKKKNSKKTQSG